MTEPTAAPTDTPENEPLPVVVPATPEAVAVIETRESNLHAKIEALVVSDEASLEVAAELLESNARLQALVDEDLGTPVKLSGKLTDRLRATFRKYMDPLKRDEKTLKGKVGAYYDELERKRTAAIEAANRQAEAAAADDDAKLEEAAALERAGDHDQAESVLAEPRTPAPPTATEPPKVKGITQRETWRAEIFDIGKVIAAAAAGDTIALGILSDDKVVRAATSVASQVAKGMKAKLSVPGVKPVCDRTVGRSKR